MFTELKESMIKEGKESYDNNIILNRDYQKEKA